MYKLKVGIIGAGNIAEEHLKVLNNINDFSVFGIVSRTQKKFANDNFHTDITVKKYIELIENI